MGGCGASAQPRAGRDVVGAAGSNRSRGTGFHGSDARLFHQSFVVYFAWIRGRGFGFCGNHGFLRDGSPHRADALEQSRGVQKMRITHRYDVFAPERCQTIGAARVPVGAL